MNKKSVHLHTGDERFCDVVDELFGAPATLFGNPAVLELWTRGFASPDCSGFALIGEK